MRVLSRLIIAQRTGLCRPVFFSSGPIPGQLSASLGVLIGMRIWGWRACVAAVSRFGMLGIGRIAIGRWRCLQGRKAQRRWNFPMFSRRCRDSPPPSPPPSLYSSALAAVTAKIDCKAMRDNIWCGLLAALGPRFIGRMGLLLPIASIAAGRVSRCQSASG